MLSKTGKSFLTAAFFMAAMGLANADPALAETRNYHIDIAEKTVNYTGQDVKALTVGGGIPGPVIEATEGDTLRATFCNKMAVESSVHWHGILLPNEQDGVPYLNSPPIKAGQCLTYEFPITHSGTYWYHSHTGLQEQRGVYGALVFHPKKKGHMQADHDHTVVLSDWNDENPMRTMHNLKRDGDFYARKKDTLQSWDKVLSCGWDAVTDRLKSAWIRMGPMDVSDVGYDAFLANGEKKFTLPDIQHGDKVKLRLVNAGASSFFTAQFAGGAMTVVAADGVDVKPFKVERLLMGTAETYDVIVSMPHDGHAYELRATAQDGTGYSSTILGNSADIVNAPDIPRQNICQAADHSMHDMKGMDHSTTDHSAMKHDDTDKPQMDHSKMDHSGHAGHVMPPKEMTVHKAMNGYDLLRAMESTKLDDSRPWQDIKLEMTGSMNDYLWSFNETLFSDAEPLKIHKGNNVRITLTNQTMMAHPFHLHGHFFRVLNKNDDESPLKHTVIIKPGEERQIEFYASEDGDWLSHCHIAYHMAAGMTRIFKYDGTPVNPQTNKLFHDKDIFAFGELNLQSNMYSGEGMIVSGRNALSIDIDGDYHFDHYDIDLHYERAVGPNMKAFFGGDFDNDPHDDKAESHAVIGLHYTLPMLIESELRVDHTGHVRAEFSSEINLTKDLTLHWRVNTDKEYRAHLEYSLDNKQRWAVTGGYDSDFGLGIGLKLGF